MTGASVIAPNKALTVTSNATSIADPFVEMPELSAGYVSVGLTVIKAEANGSFKALVDTTGAEINVKRVDVVNTYIARAEALTTPALGGVSANLTSVETNVAVSKVGTTAQAGITGSGRLTASGDVNVKVIGTATAKSGIAAPTVDIAGINIAANAVSAILEAEQYAFIEDADVTAANVSVLSELNKGRTDGALAELGSITTGSFSASLVGATSNTAVATANGTSHAYTDGASIHVGNNSINVISDATSNAVATVNLPASVAMASIGVNVITANANGSFNAYVSGNSGSINAGTLNIRSTYTSRADAKTGQSGSVKAVEGQVNVAVAATGTNAGAGVNLDGTDDGGDGEGDSPLSINAANINILADGTATALAHVGTQSGVSLASVVANVLTATVGGVQKAQLNNATVNAGSVNVESIFNNGSEEGAVAELGSSTTGSITASYYSGTVNVVTANMAGKSEASVSSADITATGKVLVKSDAKSFAKAYTKASSAELGLVSIGAVSVDADADGTFVAEILKGSAVSAEAVEVRSDFTATANATAQQPNVSLSFAAGTVNVANADAGVTSRAAVSDSDLTVRNGSTDWDLDVVGDGTATAFATITAPIFSGTISQLLISDVDASVSAKQSAYISGGSVNNAGATRVIAWLNDDEDKDQGAEAKLEATYVGISGATINTNTADAVVTAENRAYVMGTDFGTEGSASGLLKIRSDAKSVAKAHYNNSAASLNGANLGVMVMNAWAQGVFESYLDSTGAEVYVSDIDVELDYESDSVAKSTQPGGGFSASAVSGNTNQAIATSSTTATGGIRGNGAIHTGTIDVLVEGNGSTANADVDGKKVTLDGVSVGLNYAQSNLNMTQSAYMEGSSIHATGAVTVKSLMNEIGSTSELGSNGGASVSLVSGSTQWSNANASMKNSAFIGGTVNIDTTGALQVLSESNKLTVSAKAEAGNVAASVAALDIVATHAKIEGMNTEAFIGGNAVINAASVDVKATAGNDSNVNQIVSKAEVPTVSLSGVDSKLVQAHSTVRSNTTRAGVGADANITTTGDVSIFAQTNTKMEAGANKSASTGVSFMGVGRYEFHNKVDNQTTEAYLNGKVLAGGKLTVEAKDKVEADSSLNNNSIGAVTNGKNKVEMKVNHNSLVSVGANADAEAKGDVILKANAYIDLHGIVNTTNVGLGSKSEATVSLDWTRKQTISIGDHARLASRYGNLSILSGDSTKPYMNADLDMDGGGVVGAGSGPKAEVKQNSTTAITVGEGAEITALFGDLKLKTTDTTRADADARRDMVSVAGSNRSEADITVTSKSNITLGKNSSTAAQAYINGKNTYILSDIIQKLSVYAESKTISGGSKTTAIANIHSMDNEQIINLYNVFLGGIDKLSQPFHSPFHRMFCQCCINHYKQFLHR